MLKQSQVERQMASTVRPGDVRPPYERDRARIIHSSSFRRLQGKTQVLGINEGDFHRTRLTHSMEAAQIGRGIVLTLRSGESTPSEFVSWLPPRPLIEAICLAHDLGHPPFGHAGERALNSRMREHGGFEGNGQTIRLLSKLESHTPEHGLNLTRRTIMGVLKYPAPYSALNNPAVYQSLDPVARPIAFEPPKSYLDCDQDVIEWALQAFPKADRDLFVRQTSPTPVKSAAPKHLGTLYKSLDTSIMELADDIAYAVHDVEDAVALRLITPADWNDQRLIASGNLTLDVLLHNALPELKDVSSSLFSTEGSGRKSAIGAIVNAFITRCKVRRRNAFQSLLLDLEAYLPDDVQACIKALKKLVMSKIIRTMAVQTLEYRGARIVAGLFDALLSDPTSLLPPRFSEDAQKAGSTTHRLVCDYVAGMTDEFATRYYERLFVPRHGSVFERL